MAESYEDAYTESQVILTAVRIIAPFTMTYGLFLTLHGADTPGGGFQGGAIVGVTVLMLAFAFGIEPTRQWLRNSVLVTLATGGVVIFASVGLATLALGGEFLEYDLFDEAFGVSGHWGMEVIEVGGVALIVSSVVIGLFFVTAAGFPPARRSEATLDDEGDSTATGAEATSSTDATTDTASAAVGSDEAQSDDSAPDDDGTADPAADTAGGDSQ